MKKTTKRVVSQETRAKISAASRMRAAQKRRDRKVIFDVDGAQDRLAVTFAPAF